MKNLTALFSTLVLVTSFPLASNLHADAALDSADQEVQSSLNNVNEARQNYLTTVKDHGKDSPEAQAAQTKLQSARQTWHDKLSQRRQLRGQARAEYQHQRMGRMHARPGR